MITVALPDGTEVEFPDSMTDEQIHSVMSRKFGKQSKARKPSSPPPAAPSGPRSVDWSLLPLDYGARKYTAADLLASGRPITEEQYLRGQGTVGSVAEMKELENRKLAIYNQNVPQQQQLDLWRKQYATRGEDPVEYMADRVGFSPTGLVRAYNYRQAKQRFESGQADYQDVAAIARMEREQQINAEKGVARQAFDIATAVPGYVLETMATGGVAPEVRAGGTAAQKIFSFLTQAGKQGAKTALVTPRTYEEAQMRMANGEGVVEAHAKALTGQTIDRATELMGGAIPLPKRLEAVGKALKNAWVKKTGLDPGKYNDALARVGVNGVLGELLEERFAEVARGVTVDEDFGTTGDLLTGEFEKAGKQLLAEILASGGIKGTSNVLSMIDSVEKNKGKKPAPEALPRAADAYTPEPIGGDTPTSLQQYEQEQNRGKKRVETFRDVVDRQFDFPRVDKARNQDFRSLDPAAFFNEYEGAREAVAALPDSPTRGQFAKALGIPRDAIRSREPINAYIAEARKQQPAAPIQEPQQGSVPSPVEAQPIPAPAQEAAPATAPEAPAKPEAWQRAYDQLPADMDGLVSMADFVGVKLPKKGTKARSAIKAEDLRVQIADAMTARPQGKFQEVKPEPKPLVTARDVAQPPVDVSEFEDAPYQSPKPFSAESGKGVWVPLAKKGKASAPLASRVKNRGKKQPAPSGWGSVEPGKPKSEYKEAEKTTTGVDRIVQRLRKSGRDAKVVEPSMDFHRDVEKFVREFGLDVGFIDSSTRVAGVTNQRSVAFNVRSIENSTEDYIWGIAGHEITHGTGIDKMSEEFGKDLVEEWSKKYYENATSDIKRRLDDDKETYYREGVASLVQNFMQDAKFRSKLKKENTSAWSNLIDKLWGVMGGMKPESKAMKTALEVLKRAQATEEYRRSRVHEIAKQAVNDEKQAAAFAKQIEALRNGGELTQQLVDEAWDKFSSETGLKTPRRNSEQWTKDGFDLFAEDPVGIPSQLRHEDVQRAYGRANPATTLAGRMEIMREDLENNAPVRVPRAVAEGVALYRMEGEGAAKERDAFLEKFKKNDFTPLDEADTLVLRKILDMTSIASVITRGKEAMRDHSLLQAGYRISRAEQSRALSLRDPVYSGTGVTKEVRNNRAISDMLEGLDIDALQELIDLLKKNGINISNKGILADNEAIMKALGIIKAWRGKRNDAFGNFTDMIYEYYLNSVLSGPQTHVANAIGNGFNSFWINAVERTMEVAVSKATGGKLSDDSQVRDFRELGEMWKAMGPAIGIGLNNAMIAWRAEYSPLNLYTGDPGGVMSVLAPSYKIPGRIGKAIRIPFRMLAASDEFARTINAHGSAAIHAYRLGKRNGVKPEDMSKYVASMVGDYTSEVWHSAMQEAAYAAFQQDGGKIAKGFKGSINFLKQNVPTARYIFPFSTFLVNSFGRAADMTPVLGAAVAILNRNVPNQRPNWNRVAANQLIGMAVVSIIGALTSSDNDDENGLPLITGTKERNADKRGLQYRTAPPMSIRVDGKYYSYARIEPINSMLATAVDFMENYRTGQSVTDAAVSSFIEQIDDKNYAQGIEDIVRVFNGDISIADIPAKTVVGFVPNAYRQPSREVRNVVTESRFRYGEGVVEKGKKVATQAEVPFLTVGYRYDIWGRPMQTNALNTSTAYRIFSPVKVKDTKEVLPVDVALMRWNETSNDPFYPSLPDRNVKYDGKEITGEQYSEYTKEAGEIAYGYVKDKKFSDPPTEPEINYIRRALETGRKKAKANLMERLSRRNGK